MADDKLTTHEADPDHGERAELHLPPPSWVPISAALALATTLVGLVDQVRGPLGPLIWSIGLVWLIGSLVAWFRGARAEFSDLPDSLEGH